MRPLVLLWGCLVLPGCGAMKGPDKVRGYEGDTVSLLCTYEEAVRSNRKYWCRRTVIMILPRCSDTLYAGTDDQEVVKGRLSVRDSPQKLTFNVTLRGLTLQDAGSYWCGVQRLGIDEKFPVSLTVLPASPGVHPTATRAQQGKTGPKAARFPGTSPTEPAEASLLYPETSPHAVTSPYEETSLHKATSPHAGTSRPPPQLDSSPADGSSLGPRHSSSNGAKPRASPETRILAPVLVLVSLLLAAGPAALCGRALRRRTGAQLAAETQSSEKACVSNSPLGNGQVPVYSVIDRAASAGPRANPSTEIRCPSQTPEEEAASFQDPEGEASPGPSLHMSEEELRLSKFVSV